MYLTSPWTRALVEVVTVTGPMTKAEEPSGRAGTHSTGEQRVRELWETCFTVKRVQSSVVFWRLKDSEGIEVKKRGRT
jgi:hypothetical protein